MNLAAKIRGGTLPFAIAGILLLLWEQAVNFSHAKNPLVPSPTTIGKTLLMQSKLFWANAQPTLLEAAMGFAIGTTLALLIALLLVRWPALEESAYRLGVTLHSLPLVAIAPLLVLWLGSGYSPRVAIAALPCFFPTLVNAVRGFHAVDPQMMELMNCLAAGPWTVFLKLRVPSALPYLFASFKISAAAAMLGAILGEWIGAERGLGLLMLWSMFTYDVPRLWSIVVLSAGMASLAYGLVALVERVAVPWASLEATEGE